MDTAPRRIESLDALRGFVMLVMIFVNDCASVSGLPWWNYHMPPKVNGMTYVDVVFPAFLFLVGMSLPLALGRRLERDTPLKVWAHILTRVLSLLALGYLLANVSRVDPALTHLSGPTWGLLGLLGFILYLNSYPKDTANKWLTTTLKYSGLLLVVIVFALFRRVTKTGEVAWLSWGYPEILGLIARAYLAACLLWYPLRKKVWWPATLLALLTLANVLGKMHYLTFLSTIPRVLWPFDRGELPSLVVAGIVASQIFLSPGTKYPFRWAAGYAVALFGLGTALLPLGVSKGGATPAWCLYSAAITLTLFLAFYYLIDIKGLKSWATPWRAAGSNTLLAYLLPDLFYFAFGLKVTETLWGPGWPGAFGALVFTSIMLAAAHVLTRFRVRLQL